MAFIVSLLGTNPTAPGSVRKHQLLLSVTMMHLTVFVVTCPCNYRQLLEYPSVIMEIFLNVLIIQELHTELINTSHVNLH